MHAIVALVLFETQLLHDTRHFLQSSLGFGYSVKVSFSIVRFFFFLKYSRLAFWVILVFLGIEKKKAES